MLLMSFLSFHHGTFWFQIRVPNTLVGRYGRLVRQNLSTSDRGLAQQLGYTLAGQWLSRFGVEKNAPSETALPDAIRAPEVIAAPLAVAAPVVSSPMPLVEEPQNKPQKPASRPVGRQGNPDDPASQDTFDGALAYWKQLNPNSAPSTYREFQSIMREFNRLVRKRPSVIERRDVIEYRDRLVAAGGARATIAKKVSLIGTLLQTLLDADRITQNVARGIKIPKAKVAELGRRAFTADELTSIFDSSVYRQRLRPVAAGGEAAVWLPLLALSTGGRLEELAQLKTADLILDSKHGPLLRITDEGTGQRVKTVSSRRTVPIHPDLVKAGLLRYHERLVEDRHEQLFPSLEPDHDGRRGGNFGKWFARYLRSQKGCNIKDERVVFHSFRHTFKTLCREAGLPEEVHDALTGHSSASVGRSYGHVPMSTLVDGVSRIRFPVAFPAIDY